ncbi:winged helix-turn-helix transcriptional regulator [Natronorubrum sp. FCH18a]|uniref:winged helix-turn-helix transcriptional regulator n=1 Tax=Natronorubrum sp. FCH18a TaxID=3447018 RepID=UPI003F5122AB
MTDEADRGRPPAVSDEELLDIFYESELPVLTVGMIEDEVSIGRKAVHQRLQQLHDAGRVERLEVGARAVVWWPSEDK